ncbi:YdcF family protein [Aureibaculum sp. A20]|uniref:YdcF family protein n=1 Tax=Aureibaculum flavum TaxID=2795986 RepID=A0ABS0WRD2_9FLAO|nr:YdcF family protein [Aureibaculum flavum]MBJ2174539.1 YdcF family protein [Aureibaculum flavum]
MYQEILVVLGSPNSPNGDLGTISISRLNSCLKRYKKNNLVLCTGGWGPHFNISSESHASIAKNYLIDKGIPENAFLECALSSNSVDDAVKIIPIIKNLSHIKLTVITSDYHLERVKLIFNEILKGFTISYVGVESDLPKDSYDTIIAHEKKAIHSIQKNGLYY